MTVEKQSKKKPARWRAKIKHRNFQGSSYAWTSNALSLQILKTSRCKVSGKVRETFRMFPVPADPRIFGDLLPSLKTFDDPVSVYKKCVLLLERREAFTLVRVYGYTEHLAISCHLDFSGKGIDISCTRSHFWHFISHLPKPFIKRFKRIARHNFKTIASVCTK